METRSLATESSPANILLFKLTGMQHCFKRYQHKALHNHNELQQLVLVIPTFWTIVAEYPGVGGGGWLVCAVTSDHSGEILRLEL